MYYSEIYHYGTPRHSGRYPWGSGERPFQDLSPRKRESLVRKGAVKLGKAKDKLENLKLYRYTDLKKISKQEAKVEKLKSIMENKYGAEVKKTNIKGRETYVTKSADYYAKSFDDYVKLAFEREKEKNAGVIPSTLGGFIIGGPILGIVTGGTKAIINYNRLRNEDKYMEYVSENDKLDYEHLKQIGNTKMPN